MCYKDRKSHTFLLGVIGSRGMAFTYFCTVKIVARSIDVLLYSSVLTACCAVALCMATEQLVGQHAPLLLNSLHLLVFGSTLVVYNMPRIVRRVEPGSRSQRLRGWYYLFFCIGLVLIGWDVPRLPLDVLVTSSILSVFAFAYFLPLLPFGERRRLRDVGWLKITVLAGVWTTATCVLPVVYLQKHITDFPFELLLRFVFIFALCVVFDIRDMRTDLRSNIVTLPNKVGIRNSYRIIYIALVVFALLGMVQYMRYPLNSRLAGTLLTAICALLVVHYIRRQPSDRAYLLMADGIMVFYAVLVLFL